MWYEWYGNIKLSYSTNTSLSCNVPSNFMVRTNEFSGTVTNYHAVNDIDCNAEQQEILEASPVQPSPQNNSEASPVKLSPQSNSEAPPVQPSPQSNSDPSRTHRSLQLPTRPFSQQEDRADEKNLQ